MAITFVNYHLRANDAPAVARMAKEIISSRAFVSPATNRWVTVCDETSEAMDPAEIDRLATEFSKRLDTALFTFLIPDTQVFVYHLFNAGDLIDEYNSTPELDGPVTDETKARLAGRPSLVVQHCPPGTMLSAVQSVLVRSQAGMAGGFASSASAHDRAHRLADLLGIERVRATYSYYDLEMNRVSPSEQFTKVEGLRYQQRSPRRPIPPRLPPRRA
jgi:hypothetical protein